MTCACGHPKSIHLHGGTCLHGKGTDACMCSCFEQPAPVPSASREVLREGVRPDLQPSRDDCGKPEEGCH